MFFYFSAMLLLICSQLSAINELCCPGGRLFARSGAQRTHRASEDGPKCRRSPTGLRGNTVRLWLDTETRLNRNRQI